MVVALMIGITAALGFLTLGVGMFVLGQSSLSQIHKVQTSNCKETSHGRIIRP